MEIVITPEYNDLFPGEADKLEELLKTIPSLLIIPLLAMINAELYANDKGQETQFKIFDLLLRRQPPVIKAQVIENAFKKIKRNQKETVHFFSTLYNMNFLHHELVNYRDLPLVDTTPEEDLKVFKAYFLVVEEINKTYKSTMTVIPEFNDEYFGKMTWPTLIDQFELNYRIDPYSLMIRGAVFFNYLQVHSPYKDNVEQYIRKHNKVTALNYLLDIYNILIAGHQKTKTLQPGGFASFTIDKSTGFETLFEQFTMDRAEYAQIYKTGKSNYSGIKSKPLYALEENNWLILSWPFLVNKMYEGLVFDFFQESGISVHFKQFIDFKNFVGEKITEEYLSRKLLTASFKSKYGVLKFDDKSRQGLPDGYFRKGNKVILLEIKDAYFPATAISSFSYEKITAAIDLKMNNEGKGTGQFIKQLLSLADTPVENPPRYKHARNLQIYPVIIYGDVFFNMPGINNYLETSFRKKVKELGIDKKYKKIMPLTFINISFFIGNFDLLDDKDLSLTSLIEYYHKELAAKKTRAEKTRDLHNHINSYQTFEMVVSNLLPHAKKDRDYVAASTAALDLSEGLPK